MFKFRFKKFDFLKFGTFIYDLVDKYGFTQILFHPDKKELFSNSQLSHAAPGRNFNNHNGFIWAWKQKQYQVKKVLFDFWKEDNSARITMSIDLDERYITLDKIEGDVSSIQIEEVLKNNLDIFENRQNKSRIIYYFKKYFLKIIIAIIAGLIVTYVAYKSGWNK